MLLSQTNQPPFRQPTKRVVQVQPSTNMVVHITVFFNHLAFAIKRHFPQFRLKLIHSHSHSLGNTHSKTTHFSPVSNQRPLLALPSASFRAQREQAFHRTHGALNKATKNSRTINQGNSNFNPQTSFRMQ